MITGQFSLPTQRSYWKIEAHWGEDSLHGQCWQVSQRWSLRLPGIGREEARPSWWCFRGAGSNFHRRKCWFQWTVIRMHLKRSTILIGSLVFVSSCHEHRVGVVESRNREWLPQRDEVSQRDRPFRGFGLNEWTWAEIISGGRSSCWGDHKLYSK